LNLYRLQDETKVVRMVLSNVSIGISSSFSTDLISTTSFRYGSRCHFLTALFLSHALCFSAWGPNVA
jgi:hypothetical protein